MKGKKYSNFKNLPFSVAQNHQLNQCAAMITNTGVLSNNFLYKGDVINMPAEIKVQGFSYRVGCILTVDLGDDEIYPKYCKVIKLHKELKALAGQ